MSEYVGGVGVCVCGGACVCVCVWGGGGACVHVRVSERGCLWGGKYKITLRTSTLSLIGMCSSSSISDLGLGNLSTTS